LLLLVALLVPGLLLGLMLLMARVEHRLGRGLIVDQVEWMLHSELPVEQIETHVAERLVAPLAAAAHGRP
jgi:hypothetical protein